MKKRNLVRLTVLVSGVLVLAGLLHAELRLGGEAPAFRLTDITGKTHTLADYRGKYLVLEWINYDCPFVKKHYGSGNMQALQKQYRDKGVVWLSICSSAPGKQGHYPLARWPQLVAERKAVPHAVLLDTDGTVGRAYGAKTTPHLYVIDPAGKLAYRGAIDSSPSTKAEDIPGAVNYVRAALEALLAGKVVVDPDTKPYGCSVKY
jgi:peroxiredoxin